MTAPAAGPALWGGHECTVNRAGGRYRDQTLLSGHHDRLSDLTLFAELGLTALRYPVLWERVSPDRPDQHDWRWSDQRLVELSRLGVRPIVGLLHHGSGPAYTDLLDDGFAAGLARHAGAVARRYPWVEDWTPVNEPLTTARFSALYGHWHPHLRDERSFWIALLKQIDGVRLSMRAIRQVNPRARLIQTEDLGFTHATAGLADQASYENARRWMSWDLLTGRVRPGHPLYSTLCSLGLHRRLGAILDDPCPPDVIGVNHYVTSERWLDDDLSAYPPHLHGGNGRQAYADVEAVRAVSSGLMGVAGALGAAWARYGLPVALTESHLGCAVEDRMRWLAEGWNACRDLAATGAWVEAFTAWALLGSHDWDSLLTRAEGRYEAGVFELRDGRPCWTEAGRMLQDFATRGFSDRPALAGAGWWRRPGRLTYRAGSLREVA